MSSSFDWMAAKGAPLLPKVAPFAIPEKMMELKRRPTLRDIRASGYQLRQRHAPADQEVPWDRVYFWPVKKVHVVTEQEVNRPVKRRRKKVAQKGPKVVKAPQTPAREKKIAAKFTVHYDYQRVVHYVRRHAAGARADKGALEAASADAADVVPTTTTPNSPTSVPSPTLSGALLGDAAAASVDAQTPSAAEDEAQPSLLAAVFKFGVNLLFGPREPKRPHEDDNESGDAKRRRVGSDAQAPVRAEAESVAGKPALKTTGATASTHLKLTTSAAQRRARIAPKASLAECPPPEGSTSVAGNAKVVKALSLMPPPRAPARPIAGRPVRKRADTPDPRAPTPPPSDQQASPATSTPPPSDQQASSTSTPTSSPSSSRSLSPASSRSPSPAASRSLSPASSRSPSPAASRSPSPSPAPKRSGTSSPSPAPERSGGSSSKAAQGKKPYRAHRSVPHYGLLLPAHIAWTRDEFVNPWDPRAPAAPDPVYPWAPASNKWANARPAPIAPLPSTSVSFEPPTALRDWPRDPNAPKDPAASSSATSSRPAAARRDRSASPAVEDFAGSDTEVESGSEEDSGSDTDGEE